MNTTSAQTEQVPWLCIV